MTGLKPILCLYALATAFAFASAHAAPWALSYGARLTGADGAPVGGTVTLQVRFYDATADGNQLGAELDIANVTLVDGVFQTPLALDAAGMQAVFGAGAAFIEVTDATHGKTYPRQMFNAVPMAMRVPVDGTSISFNDAGALTVPAAPTPPSAGVAQSGYLSSSDWVRFNAAPQKSYVDGLTAAQATGVASLSTGLAGATANVAGLSTGLAASVANVASLSTGLATTNTNLTTTNTNLTTTNTNVTAITNAALRKDGSVPLSNTWNVGGQDVTNTGSLTMAGSKVFGLSVATSDPANLIASDIGKIWYNGGIKLWNGTSAQSLGIAGAGLMSINSLNSGTQTLSNAVTGTTPAWNSAGSTHTLNIPMANAGGTVTAGLISNGEWVLFNGKQNVLPAANAVTNGYLSGGDWTVFNAKQPLLPPGSLTANGYLASADWAVFNAKQNVLGAATGGGLGYLTASDWTTFNGREPAVTAGSTAQYYRGDKSWQTLSTANVPEAGSLYYTAARAQGDARAAVSAGTPLSYNSVTGVLSLPPATLAASGFLASSDWAAFNGKVASVTAGANIAITGTTANPAIGISGQLPVSNGGTGLASGNQGGVPYFSASNAIASSPPFTSNGVVLGGGTGAPTTTVAGSAYQVLAVPSGGGAPAFGQINLGQTAAVAGILAVLNGGTGATTTAAALASLGGVAKSGDTMTGTLNLPANGIAVGTSQVVVSSGNVGIGTTSPGALLDVEGTTAATSGSVVGHMVTELANPASSSSSFVIGNLATAKAQAGNAQNITGGLYGTSSYSVNAGTGTITGASAVQGIAKNNAGGVITNAAGIEASVQQAGAGSITSAYGVVVDSPTNSGGGSIGSYYGVYISPAAAATTNYSLYSAGGQSYFAGNVGIGTTAPGAPLEVNGEIRGANTSAAWSATSTGYVAAANTWVAIPGVSVTFTLTRPANVIMNTTGSARTTGSGQALAGLRYTVDGVGRGDSTWGLRLVMGNTSGGIVHYDWAMNRLETLAAGSHTIRVDAQSQNAANGYPGAFNICAEGDNSVPIYEACVMTLEAVYQ